MRGEVDKVVVVASEISGLSGWCCWSGVRGS